MKFKILLFLLFSVFSIFSVNADDQTFLNPTWGDISANAISGNSIPANTPLRANTASASNYCIELGATLTSFSTDISLNIDTFRYRTSQSDWILVGNDNFIPEIICNFPDPENGTGTLSKTFLEIDYSSLTYDDQFVSSGTGQIISYTNQLQDNNRLLYQILYVLTTLTFFMCVWIFYSIINDLLGKR